MDYPALGFNVRVILVNETHYTGYWDGSQWWVGVPDAPDDLPINNDYVARWEPLE